MFSFPEYLVISHFAFQRACSNFLSLRVLAQILGFRFSPILSALRVTICIFLLFFIHRGIFRTHAAMFVTSKRRCNRIAYCLIHTALVINLESFRIGLASRSERFTSNCCLYFLLFILYKIFGRFSKNTIYCLSH